MRGRSRVSGDMNPVFAPLPERSRLIRWLKRNLPKPLSVRSWESRRQFANFIRRVGDHPGARLLNVGSKSAVLGSNVFNLDIRAYPGVHVIGDGHHLPLRDRSVAGVITTSVLEHVAAPWIIVREVERVLQPGGEVYVEVPFMQPFHPDPGDYQRYTLSGLEQLFEHFTIVEAGVCVGPSSALAWILSEYVAVLLCFNNRCLYKIWVRLCRVLSIPLSLLDFLLHRISYSLVLASSHYLIGLKSEQVE